MPEGTANERCPFSPHRTKEIEERSWPLRNLQERRRAVNQLPAKSRRLTIARRGGPSTSLRNPKEEKANPRLRALDPALAKPVKISEQLAKVIGDGPMPRTEVTSKIWAYIRENDLQNPENKREIIANDDLRAVLGQEKVTMFEMTKIISRHLT